MPFVCAASRWLHLLIVIFLRLWFPRNVNKCIINCKLDNKLLLLSIRLLPPSTVFAVSYQFYPLIFTLFWVFWKLPLVCVAWTDIRCVFNKIILNWRSPIAFGVEGGVRSVPENSIFVGNLQGKKNPLLERFKLYCSAREMNWPVSYNRTARRNIPDVGYLHLTSATGSWQCGFSSSYHLLLSARELVSTWWIATAVLHLNCLLNGMT